MCNDCQYVWIRQQDHVTGRSLCSFFDLQCVSLSFFCRIPLFLLHRMSQRFKFLLTRPATPRTVLRHRTAYLAGYLFLRSHTSGLPRCSRDRFDTLSENEMRQSTSRKFRGLRDGHLETASNRSTRPNRPPKSGCARS